MKNLKIIIKFIFIFVIMTQMYVVIHENTHEQHCIKYGGEATIRYGIMSGVTYCNFEGISNEDYRDYNLVSAQNEITYINLFFYSLMSTIALFFIADKLSEEKNET